LLTLFAVSRQERPHWVSPLGHELTHAPLTHTCVAEQVVLQSPQWLAFDARSAQTPLQLVVEELQVMVQAPLPHAAPPTHTLPVVPQLLESLSRLTHAVVGPSLPYALAATSGPAQLVTHAPLEQACPDGHEWSHEPQCLALLCRVTHNPLHTVCPAGQLAPHLPPTHTCPDAHAVSQSPQWSGWLNRSAQPLPQRVRPLAQVLLDGKSM
jgi:hypothetical protein